MDRAAICASLRRQIADIEARQPEMTLPGTAVDLGSGAALPTWQLGVDAVDVALPNAALTINALHEVTAVDYGAMPAAAGFAAALVVRLLAGLRMSGRSLLLWGVHGHYAREFGEPYGPGLGALGLPAERIVMVQGARDQEILWAMEEGLANPALAAVIGEVAHVDLKATRRLMLAARKSGVAAILLRLPRYLEPGAARTRWRIGAQPGAALAFGAEAPGRTAWQVELVRAIGGIPGRWALEWDNETHTFHLAEALADRPAAARDAGAADTVTDARHRFRRA